MRSYLAPLLLALVVLASGCVVPTGPGVTGNGVVIEAFEPDFSQVYADEPVSFRIKIRNTGSVDATRGELAIHGLNEWDKSFTWSAEPSFDKLIAPDPQRGTAGESMTLTYTRKAPSEIPRGLSVNYKPTLRLTYTYGSDFVKAITLASQAELRAIQTRGEALPAETISASSSPIALGITTKGPIRFWADEGKVTFPLEITINNVGGGIACERSSTDCQESSRWNKITLSIEGADLGTECSEYSTGGPVTLWQGKSNTIVCKASFTNLGSLVGAVQKNIKVHADYGYFVDSSTAVTVSWRETA